MLLALAAAFIAMPRPNLFAPSPTGPASAPATVLTLRDAALRPLHVGDATKVPPVASLNVSLPDSWNRAGRSGLWRYDIPFKLDRVPAEHWALYIPRAGNRWRLELNGQTIEQVGEFGRTSVDFSQRPHYAFLPPQLLRDGNNTITVVMEGERARYAGLSSLRIGPASLVHPEFLMREFAQTWGSFAVLLLSGTMALIAFAIAYFQGRSTYWLFASACAFCAIRTSYALVTDPDIDYRLWNWLCDLSYMAYLVALCIFCTRTLRLNPKWVSVASTALALTTIVLVSVYAFGRVAEARQIWLLSMSLYAAALSLAVIVAWWRHPTVNSRTLAVAGGLSAALGIYDHVLVFYTRDGFSSFAVARYSLLIFLIAMAATLVTRFVQQLRRETQLRDELKLELDEAKQELTRQFEARQASVRQEAQTAERERFRQDLHDSMGLQLSGLLGMVERGGFALPELTREVRTTIDQMRMVVDASESFDGTLAELLGQIRYQLSIRLQRQSIVLHWHASIRSTELPVSPAKAIALQRLLFELTTNVLKHARASEVHVKVEERADGSLSLDFSDNGIGMVAQARRDGLGARTISKRASDLLATVHLRSTPGSGAHYTLSIAQAQTLSEAPSS